MNEISLQNESLENNLTSERPFLVTSEWGEHDGISVTFNNVERLPDTILDEPLWIENTENQKRYGDFLSLYILLAAITSSVTGAQNDNGGSSSS